MISARLVIAVPEPETRLELRSRLESLNHRVIGEAGDAETAWQLARRLRPDLVLLSTSLATGDSFEAAEAIRSGLQLPVFFLSSSYDATLLDRARQAGCDGFLVKPFTDVALDVALWMALDRHFERQSLRRDLEELKDKLEARKLINRAKAILMERYGLSEPEAFRRLQLQSMTTATPMKSLAEAVILSSPVLDNQGKQRRPTA